MMIHELKDDTRFNDMVPRDETFDTKELIDFLLTPSTTFPLASMVPCPEEDGTPDERPVGDCFLLYGVPPPIFSEKARVALRDYLDADGACYPVSTPLGVYYAFRPRKVIDALDYSQSQIEYEYSFKYKKQLPRVVKKYHFVPECLTGTFIFRLPEFPVTKVYVADEFRRAYTDSGLTGFLFEQVFPPVDYDAILREKHLMKHGQKMSRQPRDRKQ